MTPKLCKRVSAIVCAFVFALSGCRGNGTNAEGTRDSALPADASSPTLGGQLTPLTAQQVGLVTSGACAVASIPSSCAVAYPTPPSGQIIDTRTFMVIYQTGAGESFLVPMSGSDCSGNDGYYVDEYDAGETISLCRKTCTTVNNDVGAIIQVYVDCCDNIILCGFG